MAIKAGLDYVEAGAKSIKAEENAAAIKARMPTFIERATNAFAQIAELRKNSLPIDMDVMLGLARAYRTAGDQATADQSGGDDAAVSREEAFSERRPQRHDRSIGQEAAPAPAAPAPANAEFA